MMLATMRKHPQDRRPAISYWSYGRTLPDDYRPRGLPRCRRGTGQSTIQAKDGERETVSARRRSRPETEIAEYPQSMYRRLAARSSDMKLTPVIISEISSKTDNAE